ncbi:hypothetical protein ACFL3J_00785 [Candidatus Omnitrophota bacterium]
MKTNKIKLHISAILVIFALMQILPTGTLFAQEGRVDGFNRAQTLTYGSPLIIKSTLNEASQAQVSSNINLKKAIESDQKNNSQETKPKLTLPVKGPKGDGGEQKSVSNGEDQTGEAPHYDHVIGSGTDQVFIDDQGNEYDEDGDGRCLVSEEIGGTQYVYLNVGTGEVGYSDIQNWGQFINSIGPDAQVMVIMSGGETGATTGYNPADYVNLTSALGSNSNFQWTINGMNIGNSDGYSVYWDLSIGHNDLGEINNITISIHSSDDVNGLANTVVAEASFTIDPANLVDSITNVILDLRDGVALSEVGNSGISGNITYTGDIPQLSELGNWANNIVALGPVELYYPLPTLDQIRDRISTLSQNGQIETFSIGYPEEPGLGLEASDIFALDFADSGYNPTLVLDHSVFDDSQDESSSQGSSGQGFAAESEEGESGSDPDAQEDFIAILQNYLLQLNAEEAGKVLSAEMLDELKAGTPLENLWILIDELEQKATLTDMEAKILEIASAVIMESVYIDEETMQEFQEAVRLLLIVENIKDELEGAVFQMITTALSELGKEQEDIYSAYISLTEDVYKKLEALLMIDVEDEALPDDFISLGNITARAKRKLLLDLTLEKLKEKDEALLTDSEKEALAIEKSTLKPLRETYLNKLQGIIRAFVSKVKEALKNEAPSALNDDGKTSRAIVMIDDRIEQ